MPESILKAVAERLEKAQIEGVNRPGMRAEVSVYDLGVLLHSWKERGKWISKRVER